MLHYSVLALVKLILIFHVPVTFIQQSLCSHTERTALGCTPGFLSFLHFVCLLVSWNAPASGNSLINLSAEHWPTFAYTLAHAPTRNTRMQFRKKSRSTSFLDLASKATSLQLFLFCFVLTSFSFSVLYWCFLLAAYALDFIHNFFKYFIMISDTKS